MVYGSLDLLDHLVVLYDFLSLEVAAALRKRLVFQLDTAGPRILELLYGTHDIDRISESGIRIDEERHVDNIPHGANVIDKFLERDQSQVGYPEIHVGDTCAQ